MNISANRLQHFLFPTDGPTYARATQVFVRLLGLVFLIAFVSFWSQLGGLWASDGILPIADRLELFEGHMLAEQMGGHPFWKMPSLFWFIGTSDAALHGLCAAGVLASILLIVGVFPAGVLVALWLLYLSLQTAGGAFMGFQWDILLLETGFAAIFIAPWRLYARPGSDWEPSRVGRWLMWFLLFKLMFLSGAVKLSSGDETWRGLTALNYHFFTQPLPTWTSYHAHQLPEAILRFGVGVMVFIELVLPFFIFMRGQFRRVAALGFIALQLGIMATGNYGFFNILSLLLAVLLIDDALLDGVLGRMEEKKKAVKKKAISSVRVVSHTVMAGAAGLLIMLSGLHLGAAVAQGTDYPGGLARTLDFTRTLRINNRYGLFASMTTTRPEILIEGSLDGERWELYEFKYKPGSLRERPKFVAPHQPRLDWQMWFAALGNCEQNLWLLDFQKHLLEANPAVLKLLAKDPFDGEAPRFVRSTIYLYEFTGYDERRQSGHWWSRDEGEPYCPVLSIVDELRRSDRCCSFARRDGRKTPAT
ncbi:MAG: lipase maturation factor family protein [Bradymonadaceae bacterium]